jgi:hypothetical protein
VELLEQIRGEYEYGEGTIKGVARKLGSHRRMVRAALGDAIPRERKISMRGKPRLEPAALDPSNPAGRRERAPQATTHGTSDPVVEEPNVRFRHILRCREADLTKPHSNTVKCSGDLTSPHKVDLSDFSPVNHGQN